MKGFNDSLRGYGHKTHKKNNFICKYCGYNGRAFPNWLQLTVDHIVPYSQGGKHGVTNLVTVCHACNSITSRMSFPKGTSKKEIIEAKKERVKERQSEYFAFWKTHVNKAKKQYEEIDKEIFLKAKIEAYKNSVDLAYESDLLYKIKNYGHAAALAVLGIEELGKSIGYRLLYRKKILPIDGRIDFDPNELLKHLESMHFTKQSIAVTFTILYHLTGKELSVLKSRLDSESKKIQYNKKQKEFENFKYLTKEFKTLCKWRKEVESLDKLDKIKQLGFYVNIEKSKSLNIPRKISAKKASMILKILQRLHKDYIEPLI